MSLTLKTVVLKTVQAASVTLTTPAERIGLGKVVVSNPVDVLSAYPTSKRLSGLRPRLAAMAMPATSTPAERVGFSPVSGPSACPHVAPAAAISWRREAEASARQPRFPESNRLRDRFDGDCQSPPRHDHRMDSHVRAESSRIPTARDIRAVVTAQK